MLKLVFTVITSVIFLTKVSIEKFWFPQIPGRSKFPKNPLILFHLNNRPQTSSYLEICFLPSLPIQKPSILGEQFDWKFIKSAACIRVL